MRIPIHPAPANETSFSAKPMQLITSVFAVSGTSILNIPFFVRLFYACHFLRYHCRPLQGEYIAFIKHFPYDYSLSNTGKDYSSEKYKQCYSSHKE